jgi:hypothetical protein
MLMENGVENYIDQGFRVYLVTFKFNNIPGSNYTQDKLINAYGEWVENYIPALEGQQGDGDASRPRRNRRKFSAYWPLSNRAWCFETKTGVRRLANGGEAH